MHLPLLGLASFCPSDPSLPEIKLSACSVRVVQSQCHVDYPPCETDICESMGWMGGQRGRTDVKRMIGEGSWKDCRSSRGRGT